MRVNGCVRCQDFPCRDVDHGCYFVPDVDIDPNRIQAILVSEAASATRGDTYYAAGDPLFARTTVLAFNDAGVPVTSVQDILDRGVYLTTAVKCGKIGYGIETSTVKTCSAILDQELALFPKAKVLLLMGDVAIKAVNEIARRAGEKRVIPAGATYKLRGAEYSFRGLRALPSYLQAGPSFFIEKSKRKMIAEDIATAFSLLR